MCSGVAMPLKERCEREGVGTTSPPVSSTQRPCQHQSSRQPRSPYQEGGSRLAGVHKVLQQRLVILCKDRKARDWMWYLWEARARGPHSAVTAKDCCFIHPLQSYHCGNVSVPRHGGGSLILHTPSGPRVGNCVQVWSAKRSY